MVNFLRFRPHPASPEPDVSTPVSPFPEVIVSQVSLRLDPDTPAVSRDYTADLLHALKLAPRAVYDVVVAVGELVTASYLAGAKAIALGIEVHPDHVTAIVRDDRYPNWRDHLEPANNAVREALLDAITTTRSVIENALGVVNVARFSTAAA